MEQDFHVDFQVNVTCFFSFFSGILDRIVLILVWFERFPHSVQVSGQSISVSLSIKTVYVTSIRRDGDLQGEVTSGSGVNGLCALDCARIFSFTHLPSLISGSQAQGTGLDLNRCPLK